MASTNTIYLYTPHARYVDQTAVTRRHHIRDAGFERRPRNKHGPREAKERAEEPEERAPGRAWPLAQESFSRTPLVFSFGDIY